MSILLTKEIEVYRRETNFDKACDEAYVTALFTFGIDEYGHSENLPDWKRHNSWIEVEFTKYIRIGENHIYIFTITAKKNEDE